MKKIKITIKQRINSFCSQKCVQAIKGSLPHIRVHNKKKKMPWYFKFLSAIEFKTRRRVK